MGEKTGQEIVQADQRALVRRTASLVTRGLRDLERMEEALRAHQVKDPGDVYKAVALRDVERVRAILSIDPGQSRIRDLSGWTPLLEAASVGGVEVARA